MPLPKRLSQAELQQMFDRVETEGRNFNKAELVQDLVNKGVTIEGLNEPKEAKKGFFGQIGDVLKRRNEAAFGQTGGMFDLGDILPGGEPFNPLQFSTDSAVGRMATGKQSLMDTGLQIAGQGAGLIGDLTGAGLGLLGKGISALTPDVVEKPIVDTAKSAGTAILQTPVGQLGVAAIEKGTETYQAFKRAFPVEAANLEAITNIATLIPVGKGAQAGKAALSKVDDAAKALAKPVRESAEASISRVLNPTTQATKQTTQKIAGELVDRPLSKTLSLTRKGMEAKAGAAAEVAGEAIGEAGKLAGRTPTNEVINYLQSLKQQFVAGGKVVSREGVESIDEVSRIIAQYGDDVGNETLRDIRKIFDAEFYQGKKNIAKSTAETSTLNFKKQAADKIRSILGEKFPDIAKLNKEYAFWSGLEDVLGKTVSRKTGQKGALKAVATVGGAVAGQGVAGSIAGALAFRTVASLVDSPVWGFVTAKLKNQLAKALANHDLSEIGKLLGNIPGLTAAQALPDEQ